MRGASELPAGGRSRYAAAGGRWWREAGGAVADLGVFVPIAVALIVRNGLSPTAVLLPAAVLYLVVARVYRLPIAVQPLKAFGAVAIAVGAGTDVIAAGALIMGVLFLALGSGRWLDELAARFPAAVVRGIQLSVGLLFAKVAWGLVTKPQPAFEGQLATAWALPIALVVVALLLWLRGRIVVLVVVAAMAIAVVVSVAAGANLAIGPSVVSLPVLTWESFATAAVVLVLPQIPLTLANSCVAPADAARVYFGDAAANVTPGRLARTLGGANVLAGAISGMPVCHGAGGLSAHVAFGARSWRAPALMGGALLVGAVAFGAAIGAVLPAFPLPVLAALLAVAAIVHVRLLGDVRGVADWSVVLVVGVLGLLWNLGGAVLLGLVLAAGLGWWRRRRPGARQAGGPGHPESAGRAEGADGAPAAS